MSRTRRSALTLVALAAAMTAGALSFGSALAKADDMKPSPWVKSPQSGEVRRDATQGVVRDGYILPPAGAPSGSPRSRRRAPGPAASRACGSAPASAAGNPASAVLLGGVERRFRGGAVVRSGSPMPIRRRTVFGNVTDALGCGPLVALGRLLMRGSGPLVGQRRRFVRLAGRARPRCTEARAFSTSPSVTG
ncbi:hypothetical protein H7H73_27500 [Mycobacterium rufum]|uniref:Uncharacterized protein n=1 Tax=Mycolicibacterium rufum TaxID=318424 RepID=A0A9X3BJL8_9MYCO|nr:hypothetical protein [Mycolicibacterium rufum]